MCRKWHNICKRMTYNMCRFLVSLLVGLFLFFAIIGIIFLIINPLQSLFLTIILIVQLLAAFIFYVLILCEILDNH